MVVNNKIRKKLIISLSVILLVSIFLMCKSLSNRNLNKEINKVSNKKMNMYQRIGNGEYTEIHNIPSSGFILNTDNSYCKDRSDTRISNAINYQNGKVTVTSNKTLYCYLYFDKQLTAEEVAYTNSEYTNCSETQCAIDELSIRSRRKRASDLSIDIERTDCKTVQCAIEELYSE